MTTREICNRLLLIHARAVRNRNVSEVCDLICSLLLDIAAPEDENEPPRRGIGKKEDVPHRDWLDYDFVGPVCENCGVRTYKVRGEDVFSCPLCFRNRGAFAAPEEEKAPKLGVTLTQKAETFEATTRMPPKCPKCGAFASPNLNSREWWCPKHGVFHEPEFEEAKNDHT